MGTMTEKIHGRMKLAEDKSKALLGDIKNLHKESITKHREAVVLVDKLAVKLKKKPDNKKLQREYAGAVRTRDMLVSAGAMNQAIMDQQNDTEEAE